jgi:hypothetical protein
MSLAENVETLPRAGGGNYDVARFNALRHGVLSQHTVLPWENREEYLTLEDALVAEHKPQGPTEEHLVEELAGVIWRKRRLRLGENAAHHRALRRASDPHQHTAEAALINVAGDVEADCIGDAIRAAEVQTAEDSADVEEDQTMTEEALRILADPSPSAYSRALAALRDDTSFRVWSSMMSIPVTALISALRLEPGRFRWRSRLNLTAAASSGSPSWNFTPCRIFMISPLLPSVHCHSVASCGTMSSSGLISTSLSHKDAKIMRPT